MPKKAASPADMQAKLDTFVLAWETLAPTQYFGNMTLEAFKTAIAPSYTLRTALDTLLQQVSATQGARNAADLVSLALCENVVNSVIATSGYGNNSDLYAALGYIKKSDRKSGLTRKTTPPTPPALKRRTRRTVHVAPLLNGAPLALNGNGSMPALNVGNGAHGE